MHRLIRALEGVVQPMVAAEPRASEGIEVSLRAVGEDLSEDVVHLFASEKTTVRDFLNHLYLAMLRLGVRFQAFTYNQDWVLIDPETGTAFSQMGTAWARAHGKHDDYRALVVAGIRPGARLAVTRPLAAVLRPDLPDESHALAGGDGHETTSGRS